VKHSRGAYADFFADHDVYLFDDDGVAEAHDIRFVERRIDVDGPAAVLGSSRDEPTGRARVRFGASDIPGAWLCQPFVLSNEAIDGSSKVAGGVVALLFGLLFAGLGLAFLRVLLLS